MLNGSHIDLVFEDAVFKEYLNTHSICVHELKQCLHEAIVNVLEDTMSKTTLLELAIMKGLHLQNSTSKREMIQRVWNPKEQSHKKRKMENQTSTKYKCMFEWKKKHETKKQTIKEFSPTVEEEMEPNEEIKSTEHSEIIEIIEPLEYSTSTEHSEIIGPLEILKSTETSEFETVTDLDSILVMQSTCCYLCNTSFDSCSCSPIHQFCEKYQKYTERRTPNCIFDNFYSVWLPIDRSISNVHYDDINKRRSVIRNVASDTSIKMDSTGYCRYLQDINLYYPSLMSTTQKDALYFMNNQNVYPRTITDEMIMLLPVNDVYMI